MITLYAFRALPDLPCAGAVVIPRVRPATALVEWVQGRDLRDSQYPPLKLCELAFLSGQRRIQIPVQYPPLARLAEPAGGRECVLLVCTSALPQIAATEDRRVDLNDR